MSQIWTDFVDKRLKQLRQSGYSQSETAEKLSEEFGYNYTRNAVKNRESRIQNEELVEMPGYKETVEILSDGSHKSDKLLKMDAKQAKDVEYLLNAHGFDIDKWDLLNAKNNIWNTYSKQDGVQTLYSSKITVKPKVNSLSIDKLVESIEKANIKPRVFNIQPINIQDKKLLEIPLFDAHFGVSNYEYYKPTQARILNQIQSRKWEETLFIIGQDMLHNDNFKGQTANGTQIETVDMEKAWDDCESFYIPLIDESIKQSNKVKIMYSKGNHDESISYGFVRMLKRIYPEVEFDHKIQERKVHSFGKVFLGITHGDKARKNLHNIFPVEFPLEWSKASVRELHTGHYHKEDLNDVYGMMVRTLATRNKTDQWHNDNGFVGAHKRFMLFEYSEEELESIHYV